jgi:hypothetical protein
MHTYTHAHARKYTHTTHIYIYIWSIIRTPNFFFLLFFEQNKHTHFKIRKTVTQCEQTSGGSNLAPRLLSLACASA